MLKKEPVNFLGQLIRHVLFAWLFAAAVEYLLLPIDLRNLINLRGTANMSLLRVLLITACCTGLLVFLSRRFNIAAWERFGMLGLFAVLSVFSLAASFSWAFLTVCILVCAGLFVYGKLGWNSQEETKCKAGSSQKAFVWITAGLAVLFFAFVSMWTVFRILTFSTPSYDFSIFAQMFYNMKESGLPMTTVERDGLLSHFYVHVSPIYYLMLPFYCLAPTPATLQILQAAVLASAVIPLWKIGKLHGLSERQRMLLCAVLLLFPAYSGGTSYDIHENCFLTPLILWLFYGIDRKNPGITVCAAVLTLMVKEDAAVYVAVIALWLVIRSVLHHKKGENTQLITGLVMLAGSLVWFFLVTGFLASIGDGVMTYRYDNFIYDGSASLVTVIKSVIMNPMKAVFECVDPEKLTFIALTLGPLLGLPLLTRRYERYILLIPYILVNLMSDYKYQHDIFFQYTFGSTACLFYLTVVNLADFHIDRRRTAAIAAASIVSLACFSSVVAPKAWTYPVRYIGNRQEYQLMQDVLQKIPEDASVAASTFYTTTLSQREILYDIRYCTQEHLLSCDYVAVAEGSKNRFSQESFDKFLIGEGYVLFDEIPGVLKIYCKNSAEKLPS